MIDSKDILGQALWDYHNGDYSQDITVHSSIAEDDEMPIPYLFRDFKEMPLIEQKALELCKGKILDIGCGAGSHSLWLQKTGLNVTGLDISGGAVTLSRKRGLNNVIHRHILHHTDKYDSLLLLMNGTGIFETTAKLDLYLKHLKTLLKIGGQILIDGSDIKYMYKDEDGSYWQDLNNDYYGEVKMAMSYKENKGKPFDWLYLDFETLKRQAQKNELNCELILEGNHYDYLAKLTTVR